MNQNNQSSQQHSQHYYNMALQTDRRKRVDNPDGYGKRTGECGDTVEIFLIVDNRENSIDKILFETDGCLNTAACANTIAFLSEGKSIMDAWEITPEDIIGYLETLPQEETHCAEVAAGAFYLALSNYKKNQRAPWKKIYQTRQQTS